MNRAIRKLENFLQTDGGQRLLQYGYSFGAAIVILGALFKVLHLWGVWGNIIFGTGMAVEVLVFILYGFDRPSTQQTQNSSQTTAIDNHTIRPSVSTDSSNASTNTYSNRSSSPQPIYYNNSESHDIGNLPVEELGSVSHNVVRFSQAVETLTSISESLEESYRHIINNSQNISQNSLGYVQQMESLNRNIAGLNNIYEIQLKGISSQIDTLDQINNGLNSIKNMYSGSLPDSSSFKDETEKMTQQIQELNNIYGRMIQAMTISNNPAQQ